MNEPRPATISALPFESRSSVANSWNTRTGSAALSTVPVQGLPLRTYLRRSPLLADSYSSGYALLEETGESRADAQEDNDPQHRHDQSQRQTAWEHQYVNEQNVDDDRSEQGKRERDVA